MVGANFHTRLFFGVIIFLNFGVPFVSSQEILVDGQFGFRDSINLSNASFELQYLINHDTVFLNSMFGQLVVSVNECQSIDIYTVCVDSVSLGDPEKISKSEYEDIKYELLITKENNTKYPLGHLCKKSEDCYSKRCLNNLCTIARPVCGDGYCDTNERCQTDCNLDVDIISSNPYRARFNASKDWQSTNFILSKDIVYNLEVDANYGVGSEDNMSYTGVLRNTWMKYDDAYNYGSILIKLCDDIHDLSNKTFNTDSDCRFSARVNDKILLDNNGHFDLVLKEGYTIYEKNNVIRKNEDFFNFIKSKKYNDIISISTGDAQEYFEIINDLDLQLQGINSSVYLFNWNYSLENFTVYREENSFKIINLLKNETDTIELIMHFSESSNNNYLISNLVKSGSDADVMKNDVLYRYDKIIENEKNTKVNELDDDKVENNYALLFIATLFLFSLYWIYNILGIHKKKNVNRVISLLLLPVVAMSASTILFGIFFLIGMNNIIIYILLVITTSIFTYNYKQKLILKKKINKKTASNKKKKEELLKSKRELLKKQREVEEEKNKIELEKAELKNLQKNFEIEKTNIQEKQKELENYKNNSKKKLRDLEFEKQRIIFEKNQASKKESTEVNNIQREIEREKANLKKLNAQQNIQTNKIKEESKKLLDQKERLNHTEKLVGDDKTKIIKYEDDDNVSTNKSTTKALQNSSENSKKEQFVAAGVVGNCDHCSKFVGNLYTNGFLCICKDCLKKNKNYTIVKTSMFDTSEDSSNDHRLLFSNTESNDKSLSDLKTDLKDLWYRMSIDLTYIDGMKFISKIKSRKNHYTIFRLKKEYLVVDAEISTKMNYNIILEAELQEIYSQIKANKDYFSVRELEYNLDFSALGRFRILKQMMPDKDWLYQAILMSLYCLYGLGKLILKIEKNKVYFKIGSPNNLITDNKSIPPNLEDLTYVDEAQLSSNHMVFENSKYYSVLNPGSYKGNITPIPKPELKEIRRLVFELNKNSIRPEDLIDHIDGRKQFYMFNQLIEYNVDKDNDEKSFFDSRIRANLIILAINGIVDIVKDGRSYFFKK